jgi:hypothetical protein
MKIGIDINDVLYDFIGQMVYVCEKYEKGKFDLEKNPLTEFDLVKYFNFSSKQELFHFLYSGDASWEIAGQGDQLHENLMTQFNMFLVDIKDDEEHEVIVVSREYDKSIPSRLFFLSKLGCKADKIQFSKNYEDLWDDVNVLITANPKALESKPEGKISVKINASYNKESKADYELDSILDFIKDETLRNKILNTKITTVKDID